MLLWSDKVLIRSSNNARPRLELTNLSDFFPIRGESLFTFASRASPAELAGKHCKNRRQSFISRANGDGTERDRVGFDIAILSIYEESNGDGFHRSGWSSGAR